MRMKSNWYSIEEDAGMSVKIKKFMPAEGEELTAWKEFGKGFKVELRYISFSKWTRLVAKSMKGVVLPNRRLTVDDLKDDRLMDIVAREVIVNWDGLTPEVLGKMIVIDVKASKKELTDKGFKEFPCIHENKLLLLNEVPLFKDFVASVVFEVQNFHFEKKEKELKN